MRDYKNEHGVDNVRCLLVALDFSRRCIEDWELTQAGYDISLIRAKKTFKFNHDVLFSGQSDRYV